MYSGQHAITPDIASEKGISNHSIEGIDYHLDLLIQAGMLKGKSGFTTTAISRLTWHGHEFLDDIRDHDIWSKTKERVQGLSSDC
jgi:hypothetical protein